LNGGSGVSRLRRRFGFVLALRRADFTGAGARAGAFRLIDSAKLRIASI
jgi:hypothetical protein